MNFGSIGFGFLLDESNAPVSVQIDSQDGLCFGELGYGFPIGYQAEQIVEPVLPNFNLSITIRANSQLSTQIESENITHKSELAIIANFGLSHKSEIATLQKHAYFVRLETATLVYASIKAKSETANILRIKQRTNLETATALRLQNRINQQDAKITLNNYRFNQQHATALSDSVKFKVLNAEILNRNTKINQQHAQIIRNKTGFNLEQATIIYRTQFANYAQIVFVFNPIKHTKTTFIIPVKKVYQMQHTLSVTLEDGTPIDVSAIKLDLNNDSFAWQFSANLLKLSQVDLVKQTTATPVILVINIDGHEFKMLCEKTIEGRTFENRNVSLSGRSLSALLAEPYTLQKSKTIEKDLTVEQIAQQQLSPDFKIRWNTRTWKVPANTFSFAQKSPMQVITDIAANIGACVVPSPNAREIIMQSKYPVFPRDFATATPDLIIPADSILNVTYRNVTQTQANAVYIHGDNGGILARVKLKGTAADKLSSTVNNTLITHLNAARSLGETILADNYEQPIIQSITMPLGGDYPLAEIGQLARIDIDGSHVYGIINSVSIDANLESVRQTIQIGNESTNVFQSFKKVLPQQPLLVGKLSIENGKNIITFKDGGKNVVRGTGTVGKSYFVRNGVIESEAIDLVSSDVVI